MNKWTGINRRPLLGVLGCICFCESQSPISHSHTHISKFSDSYILISYLSDAVCCRKKRRANRNIALGVWRHPITLCSLVVRCTARTQQFKNVNTFSNFAHHQLFKSDHINDGELLISVPFAEFRRASFPCCQKLLIFMIFGPKAPGAPGPWSKAPWAHGTLHVL